MVDGTAGCVWGWLRPSRVDVTAEGQASCLAKAGAAEQRAMLNYRVSDLDAMLAQLRTAGVPVDERVAESEHGRFGWATDPEGNRLELWQPPAGNYPAD